ncbi:receptor-like protein 35 [Daucus carota subsp. sativus]|nr:PREDICTED: receptor-like protein 12 [Daucus carota subsp. sativus]
MNWSMSSDCCMWEGVTCNQVTRDVIGLDLSCSQLVGTILPNSTLFQLSHLQSLNLSRNDLCGVLPEDIFHLPNLQKFRLTFNSHLTVTLPKVKWGSSGSLQNLFLRYVSLNGGIPDSVGYLESLRSLSLRACNISGPIPISMGNLTQLHELDLGSNHIIGQIPMSMGNLTQLTDFDLRSNQITGQIPNSLANLQNLKVLSLGQNNLIGQFPSWVGNLRQLVNLFLSSNSFTGSLPSNVTALSFPRLATLDLSYNMLNGTIPSWLFDHSIEGLYIGSNGFTGKLNEFDSSRSALESFSCSQNLLSGTIPQSFYEPVNLSDLDFSSNNFSGVFDVEKLSHLEHLYGLALSNNSLSVRYTHSTTLSPDIGYLGLSSCKITKFPHFIKGSSFLGYLDLSNNQIDEEIPQWNASTSLESLGLYYLDLSNNQIYGEIPQWIESMLQTSLEYLNLSHNSLTGGFQYLSAENIHSLDLHSNMLNGSLPASICNSSFLHILNLSYNNFSGVLPTCPRSVNNILSVLDLRMNNITGSLPSALPNFRELRTLNLNSNKLEGTIPVSFAKFSYLEVLDIGSNQIHDTFPHCLESLPTLQVLVLKSNKFHGFISNDTKIEHPFPSLRIIDLSCNEFSGLLPEKYIKNFNAMMNGDVTKVQLNYMGDSSYSDSITVVIKGVEIELVRILTVFTTIDLSRNKFEGEIPEYIGNLKSLRYLNLSHNHLSGQIPHSIGELLLLESLDLSFNQLTGVIPPQLTCIYFLSRLNLSSNNLSGRIPQGPQFQTFENDSYAGNLGLCGSPLSKKCITETQVGKNEEEIEEDDDHFFCGFSWKSLVIGYCCGVVPGFVVGYMMFMAGKLKWFTRVIARGLGLKVRRLEIRRR